MRTPFFYCFIGNPSYSIETIFIFSLHFAVQNACMFLTVFFHCLACTQNYTESYLHHLTAEVLSLHGLDLFEWWDETSSQWREGWWHIFYFPSKILAKEEIHLGSHMVFWLSSLFTIHSLLSIHFTKIFSDFI